MKRNLIQYFVLVWMLAACGSSPTEPATTTVVPTPSSTPQPGTETLAPTVAPTDAPVPTPQNPSFPKTSCCDGREIDAGEYSLPAWLGVPVSVEVGDDWRVLNEEAARLFALGKGRSEFDDPTRLLVLIPVPEGNPQDVLTPIAEAPELTPVGDITEVTIAGFPGLQLDATANPNPDHKRNPQAEIPAGVQFLPVVNQYFAPGFIWTTWSAEARMRFIVLNVDGHLLLLQIESPLDEFEAFASEVDQMLQSLESRE